MQACKSVCGKSATAYALYKAQKRLRKIKYRKDLKIPPEALTLSSVSIDSDFHENVKSPIWELHIFLGALHIFHRADFMFWIAFYLVMKIVFDFWVMVLKGEAR